MALSIQVTEGRPFSRMVHLDGKLNNDTVAALDKALNRIAESKATVVVFDLGGLEYISSVGLRSIFRIQKVMAARGGKTLIVNPQPQIKKVLDLVQAVDVASVFASIEELDEYLDMIQRTAVEGE